MRRTVPPVLVLLCLVALSCTEPVASGRRAPAVRVSTSPSATALTNALTEISDLSVTNVRISGGSPAVVEALQRHELDVGVATADVAYLAFVGQLDESNPAFDQLRGIAVLGLNTLHLVVNKTAHVDSVADLRGLRIASGMTSGTALVSRLLLQASGVGADDVTRSAAPSAEVAGAFMTDKLDAAFMTVVPPADAVAKAMESGARLVEIEGAFVEQLRQQHPFLLTTTIPRETYPRQSKPVRTIGVDLLLVCRAELADDIVMRLMDIHFASLAKSTPVDFDRAPATSIPLHPAAARYYRQRELSR